MLKFGDSPCIMHLIKDEKARWSLVTTASGVAFFVALRFLAKAKLGMPSQVGKPSSKKVNNCRWINEIISFVHATVVGKMNAKALFI